MPDLDQEDPFDGDRPLEPSSLGQPKDKPAKSESIGVRKHEAKTGEQDMSQIPSRWERIKEHRAFKPGLAVVGLMAAVGVTLLTSRPDEGTEQLSSAGAERVPASTLPASEGIGEEPSRKSPNEHMVNGHQRLQKFGPDGTQTKVVQVSPYSRGGSAQQSRSTLGESELRL